MKTALSASIVAAALAVSTPSGADMGPPDGYVETCINKNVSTPGSECLLCANDIESGATRCAILLIPYCYSYVCMKWDDDAEWWCRTKSADAPVVPDEVMKQLSVTDSVGGTQPARPDTCAPYTAPAIPDPMAGVVDTSGPSSETGASTKPDTSTASGCNASAARGGVFTSIALLAALGLLAAHRRDRRGATRAG